MSNWYYVVGSERVGPISEAMIKTLIKDGEINADTYVWKKGFQGWERKKDVAELQFSHIDELADVSAVSEDADVDIQFAAQNDEEPHQETEQSPEINFNFDWDYIREDDDFFYIRIGKDRKNFKGTDVFGPYSLVELREALTENRINHNTLLFSPGMTGWMKIQSTPPVAGLRGAGTLEHIMLEEIPLMLVMNHSPFPLVTVIKKASARDCSVLGAGPFANYQGQTILASLYMGNEIKSRNLKLRIQNYHSFDQRVDCGFEYLDSDAKKIMLNHAI